MNAAAPDFSQIPMSQNLAATLARAWDAGAAFNSAEIGIEHVLLALADDADAQAVLLASRVDVARLKAEAGNYLATMPPHAGGGGITVSGALRRILEAAAAAARGGRRREINGAILLAAIVGDGQSAAAQILQAQGLTFDEAIRALQAALATPAPETLPDMRPADDVLARARERVQSRAAPTLRGLINEPRRQPMPAPTFPDSGPNFIPSSGPADGGSPELAPQAAGNAQPTLNAGVEPRSLEATEPGAPAPSPFHPTSSPSPADRREPELPSFQFPLQPAQNPDRESYGVPPSHSPFSVPEPTQFELNRPVPIATPPPIPNSPPGSPNYAAPNNPHPHSPAPPAPMYAPHWDERAQPHVGAGMSPSPGYAPGPYGEANWQPPQQARAPLPMPSPALGIPASPPQQNRNARPKTETGQMAENIPRSMRVGTTERVEIRIAKAAAKAITEGLDGAGVAWRHEVTITQAMSVRLRGPDGGFFIETVSPETQWIENQLGFGNDEYASWRFLVTPQSRGHTRLQIVVSARTIGADGMAAETALPDQVVEVRVRTNYRHAIRRWLGWIAAAIAGGALAKFGETGLSSVSTLIAKFMN